MAGVLTHRVASGVVYDPLSVTYFAAHSTQLDTARKDIVDTFIKALRGAGLLAKLDFLHIHALVTEQQALTNVITQSGALDALVKVGAPTFTTKVGHVGIGNANNRLDTDTNLSSFTNFTQNSASFGFWSGPTQNANVIGMGTNDANNWLCPQQGSNSQYGRINMSTNTSTGAGGGGDGLHALNRSASNAWQQYKNGSSFDSGTTASVARGAVPMSVVSVVGAPASTSTFRISFAGASLTAGEHDALYSACNTLLTNLDLQP